MGTLKARHRRGIITLMTACMAAGDASARCGGVDYSWGADALATMHDYVVTMMMYTLYIIQYVAAIVGIVSVFQIFYKMNTGDDSFAKSVTTLVGACLFFIGATMVLPAFYGYRI